jgi:hypothetical protein
MRFTPQLILAVVALGLLAGCARNYSILTNNGGVITARGKPVFDKQNAVFVYRDLNGVERIVPAGSVRQIAPASDTSNPTRFNPR